jgi:hypothetical protein
MLALISSLVLAQFSPPLDDNGEWRVEGRCTYPPALVEQAGTAILVECGQATLSAEGITLAARGFHPLIAFRGQWDGEALQVSEVARRGIEEADAARGFCRLQTRNEELTAIVCSVIAGPRSYVVNFLVPRLNSAR